MKIGIVTVHDSNNYGSFLQAYALQCVLQQMGHEVYFAVTRDKKFVKKIFVPALLQKKLFRHPFSLLRSRKNGRIKRKAFLNDQKCFEEIEKEDLSKMDLVILGSDEIWNVCTPVFRNPMFYGEGAWTAPTAAFAVSAGRAGYEDFRQYPDIIERIKRIPEIFVRDQNTMDIVEKITGECPKLVCDPTFLVPVESMKERYEDQYLREHRYLAVYLYPGSISKENVRQIRKFARKEKLTLVSVGFCNSWCDYNVNCRPLEFPSVLEGAEAVITGTFHGTIFSVLNHKQFVSISLTPKVKDLLRQLGIEERCADKADLSEGMLENKLTKELIDYGRIEETIRDMRRSSLLHLKGVITEYDK